MGTARPYVDTARAAAIPAPPRPFEPRAELSMSENGASRQRPPVDQCPRQYDGLGTAQDIDTYERRRAVVGQSQSGVTIDCGAVDAEVGIILCRERDCRP